MEEVERPGLGIWSVRGFPRFGPPEIEQDLRLMVLVSVSVTKWDPAHLTRRPDECFTSVP